MCCRWPVWQWQFAVSGADRRCTPLSRCFSNVLIYPQPQAAGHLVVLATAHDHMCVIKMRSPRHAETAGQALNLQCPLTQVQSFFDRTAGKANQNNHQFANCGVCVSALHPHSASHFQSWYGLTHTIPHNPPALRVPMNLQLRETYCNSKHEENLQDVESTCLAFL